MRFARILKVIVIIEWVLGFILGILSGSAGTLSAYGGYYGMGFNFWGMLFVWIVFFIGGMFQYGFAELLEEVSSMRERTDQQLYHLTGVVQHLEGVVVQNAAKNNTANNS